jgi:hypothetical protein
VTTTYEYRAQTDPTIKTWHLGAVERGAACFCGVRLLTPDDERAFALKVPAEKRRYETSDDLARVTCGSCKRNREWKRASGVEAPAATPTPARTRRRASTRASTRAATPADAGAGMNEYTAAQLLVDGVQARARSAAAAKETAGQAARPSRRRARTGDPRADRAAAGSAG